MQFDQRVKQWRLFFRWSLITKNRIGIRGMRAYSTSGFGDLVSGMTSSSMTSCRPETESWCSVIHRQTMSSGPRCLKKPTPSMYATAKKFIVCFLFLNCVCCVVQKHYTRRFHDWLFENLIQCYDHANVNFRHSACRKVIIQWNGAARRCSTEAVKGKCGFLWNWTCYNLAFHRM